MNLNPLSTTIFGILDNVHYGILILNSEKKIIFQNAKINDFFSEQSDIFIEKSRLYFRQTSSINNFNSALDDLSLGTGAANKKCKYLLIEETVNVHPLIFSIQPIFDKNNIISQYCIIVSNRNSINSVDNNYLKFAYGLTNKECQIINCLLEGTEIKAIAINLDISVHTVRTHLRQIFKKTSTSSQVSLVNLTHSFPLYPIL